MRSQETYSDTARVQVSSLQQRWKMADVAVDSSFFCALPPCARPSIVPLEMGRTLPKAAGLHPALGLMDLVRTSAGDGPGRVASVGERSLPRLSTAPPSTGELL